MTWQDAANGGFEALASLAVLRSCWILHKDKMVRGVSLLMVAFFTVWGAWNVYYYPFLGQTLSFVAGVAVLLSNALYVSMLAYYRERNGRV